MEKEYITPISRSDPYENANNQQQRETDYDQEYVLPISSAENRNDTNYEPRISQENRNQFMHD